MITVVGLHVCVDIRGINVDHVSKEEFKKEIDEVCALIQKNTEDIKHYLENYLENQFKDSHTLTIYKR
ncbi:hypothetical protein [Metabacillus dongyingensis]|uniref:hypothetical protein n=1 Tax=Metabacillus dongyingensis TaxID=2874282 RepID=UPI001CBB8C41|nr:hypothetical protein [Metabacillus dongyingensis]UAL52288.1 hypothetical protein K8L98_24610 [Metabacillus dongyingensis]